MTVSAREEIPDISRPPTLCCVCDAKEGKCEHTGFRYRDPIAYHRVIQRDGTPGWVFPTWHGQGVEEARLYAQLRNADARAAERAKPDVTRCTDCGDWLATFQITNGFSVCSACYRRARLN